MAAQAVDGRQRPFLNLDAGENFWEVE